MPNAPHKSSNKLRLEIAQTAARFVAVDGVNDFFTAKRKAALQMGVNPDRNMPTNLEVEQALQDYQCLFQADLQEKNIRAMRESALKAMRFLEKYHPRLVGPVLNGTATQYSDITLHLFSDHTDDIGFDLSGNGIPFDTCEKSIRINVNEKIDLPAYKFVADKYSYLLIVFLEKQKNINPLSSRTNKPMERISLNRLESLLNGSV